MDLTKFASNIKLENGIYFSSTINKISYPSEGNSDSYLIEDNSFWYKHRNRCITSLVKQFLKKDDLFFDVGGGNGFVTKGLENSGINSVLIEPGINGAKNARKRNVKHIICATLEDTGFRPNTLDAIGLFDVVEHIEDDNLFLSMINTYLKPKGKIFITVPAFSFLWSEDDEYAQHYRRYTTKSMKKVLQNNQFKILYSTYIFSILLPPIFLFRRLPKLLRMKVKPSDRGKQENDHESENRLVKFILDKVWNWEISKIENLNKIPFGGSCLIVAEKYQ